MTPAEAKRLSPGQPIYWTGTPPVSGRVEWIEGNGIQVHWDDAKEGMETGRFLFNSPGLQLLATHPPEQLKIAEPEVHENTVSLPSVLSFADLDIQFLETECFTPCTPNGCPGHETSVPEVVTIGGVVLTVDAVAADGMTDEDAGELIRWGRWLQAQAELQRLLLEAARKADAALCVEGIENLMWPKAVAAAREAVALALHAHKNLSGTVAQSEE